MFFSNKDILDIAMKQSAVDIGCSADDFCKKSPVIIDGSVGKKARVYYKEPISCNFVSYGNNVVASVKPEIREIISEYVNRYEFYHLFETPNALWLNEHLEKLGHKLCFMAYYFLPDMDKLKPLNSGYDIKKLNPNDFEQYYAQEWKNAILEERRELDMMAYGAYEGNKLVGLAGCSADCETMWQIGVDVLPEFRRKGIASVLTSNLAIEILKLGKVPFYCCAWSNIPSAKNALKSGFKPAWVEMTVKPSAFVDELNNVQ